MTEQDRLTITAGVEQYCKAVHTQAAEDFFPLWSTDAETALISIGKLFKGTQSIYEDFLVGLIQKAYERIDLIADSLEMRELNPNTVVVIFAYHTECVRRKTGEAYGIEGLETQVWIREDSAWKLNHVHYSKVG